MTLKELLTFISNVSKEYLIDKPYLVGGLPRDLYLGMSVKTTDIDVTTNSSDVMRLGILISDKLNVTFDLSDDSHITVFSDEFDIDFSSHFVSDDVLAFLPEDKHHIAEVYSRDFTINTLHQDLETFKIVDPTGQGFDDIKNKLIKTPVPPEITIKDDPRRAFRAIELATRYKFDIDPKLKEFIISNEDLFSVNIKDKYISAKINKSLKNDEQQTLKLLKELNLFARVPLVGYFKDVLIGNKILLDYLDLSSMNKKSSVAKNWEEYISNGPEYLAVQEYWLQNYSKISPGSNDSYHSWTSWYNSMYNSPWDHKHKSPQETLEIMKTFVEIKSSPDIDYDYLENAKRKFFNIFKKRNRQEKLDNIDVKINHKSGVDVDNLIPELKSFLSDLFLLAEKKQYKKPIVTSGYRSVEQQANIMRKNWKANGGFNGGREYLQRIYGKEYGNMMANVFENKNDKDYIQHAIDVILSRPVGSSHILNPSQAVDLALTPGIYELIQEIKSTGKYNMSIKDETDTAGPHYHVSIKPNKLSYRKNILNNLIKSTTNNK